MSTNVRIVNCCWCKNITLHLGEIPSTATFAVHRNRMGSGATVDGVAQIIADGICEPCKVKQYADLAASESRAEI